MSTYNKMIDRELVTAKRIVSNLDMFGESLVELACRVICQHGTKNDLEDLKIRVDFLV